jgi:hypothetical protein
VPWIPSKFEGNLYVSLRNGHAGMRLNESFSLTIHRHCGVDGGLHNLASYFVRPEWVAEIITLNLITSMSPQKLHLRFVLNAFRKNL